MPFERFGYYHHGPNLLAWLFFALLVALLVLLVLAVAVRLRERQGPWRQVPASASPDPSLAALRLRYARGEIDRVQFLQMSRDLGAAPVGDDETTAVQPPP